MLSDSTIQNQQGATENFKSSNALKRRIGMVNGHSVTFVSGEEPEERPAKRPQTAGSTAPADPTEAEVPPIQPELGAWELGFLAILENEMLKAGNPKIFGKFDLFDMNDPRHTNVYRSTSGNSSDSKFHPESLFKMLHTHSGNKFGKVDIPQWYIKTQGSLNSPQLCNIDGPLEISVVNLLIVPSVELNNIQGGLPASVNNADSNIGPSVEGYLTLDARKLTGVKTALGNFKMRPVWKEATRNGRTRELFEGSLSFKLVYGDVLKRLGYQDLVQPALGFWAIRAAG